MITDYPIDNIQQDKFNRDQFASKIVNVIESEITTKSYSIGLYGKWGEGKTSIINLIKNKLTNDYHIIEYAPWLISDTEIMIKSFFTELINQLNKESTNKKNVEKIGRAINRYEKIITAGLDVSGFGILSKIIEGISKLFKESNEKSALALKNELDDLFAKLPKKIVIIIDDIDRCDTSGIQVIIKLIKLVADFPNTVYLLPMDKEYVATAIDKVYPNGGNAYLEKIIQIPVTIPKITTKQLREYFNERFENTLLSNKIGKEEIETETIEYLHQYYLKQIKSPRQIIRYFNSLSIKCAMMKGEINLNDLIILESFYHQKFKIYEEIKNNYIYFTQINNNSTRTRIHGSEHIDDLTRKEYFEKITDGDEAMFQHLKWLFPQLATIHENVEFTYENKLKWIQQRRICSIKFYERYFSYQLDNNEISEIEFDRIMKILSGSLMEKHEDVNSVIGDLDKEEFIYKVEYYANVYNGQAAFNLLSNLSFLCKNTTVENSVFGVFSDSRTALISILRSLIKTGIEKKLRVHAAHQIITNAEALDFLTRFWASIQIIEGKEYLNIFNEPELKEILKLIFERFKEETSPKEMIMRHEEISYANRLLYEFAFLEKSWVIDDVNYFISKSPENAIKIILMYSNTMLSTTEVEPYKSNLPEANYKMIKEICDIDRLSETIAKKYGTKPMEVDKVKNLGWEKLTESELVSLFQRRYLEDAENSKLDNSSNQ